MIRFLGIGGASERKKGNRARDARRWSEAAHHYRRHLERQSGDFPIWVQLGHMCTQLRDYDEADKAYRRAATLSARDADLFLCWGHSRKLAGDTSGARRYYAESFAIDENEVAQRELDALELPSADSEAASAISAGDPPAELEPSHEPEQPPRRAWEAASVTVKPFIAPMSRETALFVTHSATGAVKPHVLPYIRALEAQGIAVFLVAVTDRELDIRPDLRDAVAGLIIRENAGYDFAAWAHALHLYPELLGASVLYLLNDSVVCPSDSERLERVVERVRSSDADLIGLTESHEYRWHLQTFFLALKPRLLSSQRLLRFFNDVRILEDKDRVIQSYEVRFAQEMERAGYTVETLFPSRRALNPTLYDWRQLISDGFPFMKLLPLRGAFPEIDIEGWRDILEGAGFDIPLIEATIGASEEQVPREGNTGLYAHPIPYDRAEGRPIRVAFYGPWNYDNGLGAASRAIIAAIRRSGVRLNLHPIKKPFHVHQPLAPPVDVVDFGGPADVAIVHLNPDSWFLLTDEQRHAIKEAHRRIGYWVWEMGHIPPAWRHDFSSVDRIWAPSRYCADLFAAQDEAPVDVIPHPVPLPDVNVDRAAVLERLDLSSQARIILFVFDGSSYLIRKNPAALVRAFAASNLAAEGWTLILKTKHLMDRPEEGAALKALADATAGVILIDRALGADELQQLQAVADIYASPHCSEGFGLTIAEAMAAGKKVVATDFGGSTDYLDGDTGYPVKARPWTLTKDFGHYTSGGTWARIDEPALTAALIAAAKDDDARARTARGRVAASLSYDSIGARIAESLRAVLKGPGAQPRIEHVHPRFDRGTKFEDADFGRRIHAIALDPTGACAGISADLPTDADAWIAFAPAGSIAAPDFADHLNAHIHGRPHVSIFYADDVAVDAEQPIDRLRVKPEFDVTLLAGQDYVGAPVVVRASALATLKGLRPEMGTAVMADLLFRAHAAGMGIGRIPHVLLGHRGKRVRARADDYANMLRALPALRNFDIVPGAAPETFALVRRFRGEEPAVTIIVPTRRSSLPNGDGTYVERLLEGLANTDWPMHRLTVIIGDDVSGTPDWQQRDWPFTMRRIETPREDGEPFNYASKMNRLWREATTEQIVFLNDDIAPSPNWLRALQTFAVDPDIGGVGARLLFEDGSLQHAGMGPHGDGAAHCWVFRKRIEGTYQEWARTQREWSMVTGAVFATRRSLLDQVEGFDERLRLEFNDTDLCLKLRTLGYRIVCTPLAEMTHTEKASRGEQDPPGADRALFLSRWKPFLDQDPAWHPCLRRDRLDLTPQPESNAWYL